MLLSARIAAVLSMTLDKSASADAIGDDVAPGDDVVRRRIPDQVRIIRRPHRLERRIAGLQAGEIVSSCRRAPPAGSGQLFCSAIRTFAPGDAPGAVGAGCRAVGRDSRWRGACASTAATSDRPDLRRLAAGPWISVTPRVSVNATAVSGGRVRRGHGDHVLPLIGKLIDDLPNIGEELLERHLAVVIGICIALEGPRDGIAQRPAQSIDARDAYFRRLGVAIDRGKKRRAVKIEFRARIVLAETGFSSSTSKRVGGTCRKLISAARGSMSRTIPPPWQVSATKMTFAPRNSNCRMKWLNSLPRMRCCEPGRRGLKAWQQEDVLHCRRAPSP